MNTIKSTTPQCMINIFMGGEGVVDGEGVAVKDVKVGKGEVVQRGFRRCHILLTLE